MGHLVSKNVFTILFRLSDEVIISYLDKGMTINNQSFIKDCLKHLLCTLQEPRPRPSTKNLKFHQDNAHDKTRNEPKWIIHLTRRT